MDGKLILVNNTPDLLPTDLLSHYKSLEDIERGFRVQNSELEIGPVLHRSHSGPTVDYLCKYFV